MSVEERFWAKTERTATCWLWRGNAARNGYGQMYVNGKSAIAHRLAYELLVAPIPDGLELDHLCRVPLCVNPAHLEPVTHAENMRRARRLECVNGHPLTDENVYVHRSKRYCRPCRRERNRSRRAA